jgi:hypothetical protein
MRDIISCWGLGNNTLPVTISLPLLLPFLRDFPLYIPLAILCTLSIPGPFLTALCVLLTLAVVIVIAIARTTPSTAQLAVRCPILNILIIIVDSLIPSQWSNSQDVVCLLLPAAWWLNLCC